MEQLAWTLLGLMAAQMVGSFFYLGSRIDRLFSEIGALRADMGELRGEICELRGEIGELRGEMHVVRHSFETHLRDLHGR